MKTAWWCVSVRLTACCVACNVCIRRIAVFLALISSLRAVLRGLVWSLVVVILMCRNERREVDINVNNA